jgi:hypothetical protein
VEYVYNTVDTNMTMPASLPLHWAYDYAGLTNGQTLTGLLGYEVDGCWIGIPCRDFGTDCPDTNSTTILADSVFWDCGTGAGHAYMATYTALSGAHVFATGSMQWNWGLDDYGTIIIPTNIISSLAREFIPQLVR